MATDSLLLRLELERTGEPITGRLGDEDGESVSFTGWLELMAAVEAARAGAVGLTGHEPPAPHF